MTEEKPQIPITKEGYENLKKRIKIQRRRTTKKITRHTLNQMRSQGDLSENDGYTIELLQIFKPMKIKY
jgi:transcription elongation GreA/GreB family factor